MEGMPLQFKKELDSRHRGKRDQLQKCFLYRNFLSVAFWRKLPVCIIQKVWFFLLSYPKGDVK